MIYALRSPLVLLGMVAGFAAAAALRAVLFTAGGRRSPFRRKAGQPFRRSPRQPRSWGTVLDPFGTLAAVIGGIGWLPPDDAGSPARRLAADVASFAVVGVLGMTGLVLSGASIHVLSLLSIGDVLHGSVTFPGHPLAAVSAGAGCIGLACALLALVPLPPLPMGTLVWTRLPRTPQARRFAYRLVEEHWGVAAVLLLVLLPVARGVGPLFALTDTVGDALLRLVG